MCALFLLIPLHQAAWEGIRQGSAKPVLALRLRQYFVDNVPQIMSGSRILVYSAQTRPWASQLLFDLLTRFSWAFCSYGRR